jgi:DNA-binding beta-propeller fold protein YncE
MRTNSTSPRSGVRRVALRLGMTALLCACAAALSTACRKGDKAAGTPGEGTPATSVSAVPAAPDLGPHISDKADAGNGPFAGLIHPRAAAVDDRGRLWVADFGHAAVRFFDGSGGLFGGWGGIGDGEYGMKDPCGIAVHGNDVYVADTWKTGVEHFTASGDLKGKSSAGLYGPHGLAVGGDGTVFIADTGNGRIVACDPDLSNPRNIGKAGAGNEEFSAPIGIAVGPSGGLYVADTANRRVQILDGKGKFKSRFKYPWSPNSEAYIDVDQDESIFVSDPNAEAVIHLDHNGRELHRWTEDAEGKKFLRPTGVAVDRKNRVLYVVNTDSDSIARIKLEK